jgi:hypothetical protein
MRGTGVAPDLVQAFKWLDLAVNSPIQSEHMRDLAAGYRDAVSAKLSPDQLREARKLVMEQENPL